MQWQALISCMVVVRSWAACANHLRYVSALPSQNGFSGTPITRLTYDFPIHANSALACQSALAFTALIDTLAAVGSYPVLSLSVANGAKVSINAHQITADGAGLPHALRRKRATGASVSIGRGGVNASLIAVIDKRS